MQKEISNRLKVAEIFNSNMVLQREKPLEIWGTGKDGQQVTVKVKDQIVTSTVKEKVWQVKLDPLPVHGVNNPLEILISSNDELIVLKNVLVGDVFLAGGQSNMTMPLRLMDSAFEDLKDANVPEIRLFDLPARHYEGSNLFEGGDGESGLWEIKQANLGWQVCTSQSVRNFSAVAYYFAKDIHITQNIPVGIISCNWGGKSAACWIGEDYLRQDGELKRLLKHYLERLAKMDEQEYERKFTQYSKEISAYIKGKIQEKPIEPFGKFYSSRPSGLFNTMLKVIAPFQIKGVLWYQGESDDINYLRYEKLLTSLINCWRTKFNNPELPFLIVQLPGYQVNSQDQFLWGYIREAQFNVSKNVKHTYLAVGIDAGDANDIHPTSKKKISHRLALLARRYLYCEEIMADSPRPIDIKFNGNKVIVTFNNVAKTLLCPETVIKGFLLCGADQVFKPAQGQIKDNQVELSQPEIALPVEIRYGYTNYSDCNLYSDHGLPVIPFSYKITNNKNGG